MATQQTRAADSLAEYLVNYAWSSLSRHLWGDEARRSALWRACRDGDAPLVQDLLSRTGKDRLSLRDVEKSGVLLSACAGGRHEVVRLLLRLRGDRYLNVHAGGPSLLRAAAIGGNVRVLQELLAMRGDRFLRGTDDAFIAACAHGHVDVVRELLALCGERRVPPYAIPLALRRSCRANRGMVVRQLLALRDDRAVSAAEGGTAAFAAACVAGSVMAVGAFLAAPPGVGAASALQTVYAAPCMAAVDTHTTSLAAWRAFGRTVRLGAWCPFLAAHAARRARRLVWASRRRVVAARRAARAR
uniref:Uncharacterized protein n=1 Tax=viral metagenome TaxID=1070528 RepID=A0A6C0ATD0_9ZZZZ